jgi:hypothetical protein
VVIDKNDLKRVAKGDNFLSILRTKYEKVRLDILDDESVPPEDKKASGKMVAKRRNASKHPKSLNQKTNATKQSHKRNPSPKSSNQT